MRRMELSKTEKAILVALAGGAIVLTPMGGRVVVALAQYYFKKWWDKEGPYIPPEKDPELVRESLYRLKKNKYVDWKYDRKKNVVGLKMTTKGKRLFGEKSSLEDLKIIPSKDWDGRWRFVLFDVPEKSRSFRDALRYYLKNMGFFQFQKSVWIYPFECEREIAYLCEFLGIKRFTITFTAKINNDRILRRYFLMQGVLLRKHLSFFDKGVRY